MDRLAEQYRDEGVGSYFLYVNEAHPGELYPCHTSLEQKLRQARGMGEVYGLSRPVIVDSLSGDVHRHYGSMPNMSWIFNRAGRALYKSDWTDSSSVGNALEYFLRLGERRRAGENLTPFNVQRVDYRSRNREQFFVNLARGGPQAVSDFIESFGDSWATEKAEDHDPPPD